MSSYTKNDIKKLLKNYIQVKPDKFGELKPGVHLRYFLKATKGRPAQFKSGGFLVNFSNKNGKLTMSYFYINKAKRKVFVRVSVDKIMMIYRKLSDSELATIHMEKLEKKLDQKLSQIDSKCSNQTALEDIQKRVDQMFSILTVVNKNSIKENENEIKALGGNLRIRRESKSLTHDIVRKI